MSGPVALVGAGAFPASMTDLDRALLAATGRRRPRVAILPTGAFPAGEDAFRRVSAMGEEHFRSLGAEVETVAVRDRAGADDVANAQAIGEADVIYLCDGDADHLVRTLIGSAVWAAARDANDRGAVLVGCAAGAMVLGEHQVDVGIRRGWPVHWRHGLAAAGGIVVLPRYDAHPEPVMALLALRAPQGITVVGIDRDTAVIGRDGTWEVRGLARVTIWRGRHRERRRAGEAFRIGEPVADEAFADD